MFSTIYKDKGFIENMLSLLSFVKGEDYIGPRLSCIFYSLTVFILVLHINS